MFSWEEEQDALPPWWHDKSAVEAVSPTLPEANAAPISGRRVSKKRKRPDGSVDDESGERPMSTAPEPPVKATSPGDAEASPIMGRHGSKQKRPEGSGEDETGERPMSTAPEHPEEATAPGDANASPIAGQCASKRKRSGGSVADMSPASAAAVIVPQTDAATDSSNGRGGGPSADAETACPTKIVVIDGNADEDEQKDEPPVPHYEQHTAATAAAVRQSIDDGDAALYRDVLGLGAPTKTDQDKEQEQDAQHVGNAFADMNNESVAPDVHAAPSSDADLEMQQRREGVDRLFANLSDGAGPKTSGKRLRFGARVRAEDDDYTRQRLSGRGLRRGRVAPLLASAVTPVVAPATGVAEVAKSTTPAAPAGIVFKPTPHAVLSESAAAKKRRRMMDQLKNGASVAQTAAATAVSANTEQPRVSSMEQIRQIQSRLMDESDVRQQEETKAVSARNSPARRPGALTGVSVYAGVTAAFHAERRLEVLRQKISKHGGVLPKLDEKQTFVRKQQSKRTTDKNSQSPFRPSQPSSSSPFSGSNASVSQSDVGVNTASGYLSDRSVAQPGGTPIAGGSRVGLDLGDAELNALIVKHQMVVKQTLGRQQQLQHNPGALVWTPEAAMLEQPTYSTQQQPPPPALQSWPLSSLFEDDTVLPAPSSLAPGPPVSGPDGDYYHALVASASGLVSVTQRGDAPPPAPHPETSAYHYEYHAQPQSQPAGCYVSQDRQGVDSATQETDDQLVFNELETNDLMSFFDL